MIPPKFEASKNIDKELKTLQPDPGVNKLQHEQ